MSVEIDGCAHRGRTLCVAVCCSVLQCVAKCNSVMCLYYVFLHVLMVCVKMNVSENRWVRTQRKNTAW